MYRGLEALVENNLNEIVDGFAWIVLGKRQLGRGRKSWVMIPVYTESADENEFEEMKRLVRDDKDAIMFNGHENAWVGVDGVGGTDVSIRDVSKRLKNAYQNGFCRATEDFIDSLIQ